MRLQPESESNCLLRQVSLNNLAGNRAPAGTLKGSRFANMKELRFDTGGGVWRFDFAFDPARKAILLVAADKSGVKDERFIAA